MMSQYFDDLILQMKKITQENFLKKCFEIWSSTYDLSKVFYTNKKSKITVTCKIHGDFNVSAENFIYKLSGCPICGGQIPKSSSQFISDAKKIHFGKYDYSKSNYSRYNKYITITCLDHGDFLQKPYIHLRGSGCPSCAKSGYNPSKEGYVYVLSSLDKRHMKIGLSNNPEQRIKILRSATPFKFYLVGWKKLEGQHAPKLETLVHKLCESANLLGFDGCTEWFMYDESIISRHIYSL